MFKCNIFILPIEARLSDKDTDSVNESGPGFGCTSPDNNNSDFESAAISEPSVFELLKFYCIIGLLVYNQLLSPRSDIH